MASRVPKTAVADKAPAPVIPAAEPLQQKKHVAKPPEQQEQDMAAKLVQVLRRTLDGRLKDIKERLDSVESNHHNLGISFDSVPSSERSLPKVLPDIRHMLHVGSVRGFDVAIW